MLQQLGMKPPPKATVMAALVAAMGAVGAAAPALLLEFAQPLQSPAALYTVAAIRAVAVLPFAFGVLVIYALSAPRRVDP